MNIIKIDTDQFPVGTFEKKGKYYEVCILPKHTKHYEKKFKKCETAKKWLIKELKKHYTFSKVIEWETELKH